jgi:poly(hydroxyalkanoate) depolymerase family esterase
MTSPKWQSPMKNCKLIGDPRVPNFVSADGQILKIWPTMQFWTYVPPSAGPNPPLVVFLHGSTQTVENAARGVRWNELADQKGFVIVYPQQADNTWNWGQTTAYGRGVGDLESVYRITRYVQSHYQTDPTRTYVMGLSSGAITSTMLGAAYADAYTAVGSFMGSSYNESDPHGEQGYQAMADNAKIVPAFHVHGTADHLFPPPVGLAADTGWAGTNDWADNGAADGSVSQSPEIDDSHLAPVMAPPGTEPKTCPTENNNPCSGQELGYETYGYEISRYRQTGGNGCVLVEGWMVEGLAHNYVGGDQEGTFVDPTGPDITTAAWDFFEQAHACLNSAS